MSGSGESAGGRLAARRAAERLILLHGDALLATARRYTLTLEDAEDAHQRGIEILLTKAPAVTEEELLPWIKTVIKHEAFAIWRSRERAVTPTDDEVLEQAASGEPSPEEQVESYERLRLGAEAIGRLKPQEVRCLLLRAEGHSYRQICHITGWSYTKVNRCLTEGRRSFLQRIAGIESGAECDRLAPLLSMLADGEASAGDMTRLRPHLRSCLSCRATLRAYRDLPHRAAEVMPAAGAAEEGPAALLRWVESVVVWAQERVALIGAKAQAATEAATSSKVAAVAASTAALAGGTVAVRSLGEDPVRAGPRAAPDHPERVLERAAPANLLPRLPEEVAGVEAEPAPAPPVAEIASASDPPVPPPLPPAPGAALPPAPPPGDAPVYTPAPRSLPTSATVPVTNPGRESALPDVEEDERRIDPMTKPIDRPTRRSAPAPPQDGL